MDIEKAYHLFSSKVVDWLHEFVLLLPNIFLAAVILALGFLLAGTIRKISKRLAMRFSKNATLTNLFSSIIYLFFVGITIFIVLSILQLDKAVTSILAGAGLLGLALAFAFQDIAANFISGIFISFRRPIHIGDIVKIGDYMGKITDINLRDTVVLTFQGQMVIIPNKNVFQNPIENYSLLGKRRLDLTVGVSYDSDLESVQQITLDAVKDIEGLSPDDEVTMYYTEFADSSINYIIRLWISNPEQSQYWIVSNKVIINIKKAYDKHNISIPFPIRTLEFPT